MRQHIRSNVVQVIGHIWQPGVGVCAMSYTLRDAEAEAIKSRADLMEWTTTHTRDFQEILDAYADLSPTDNVAKDVEIPWADEESEWIYTDCMFPMPESEWV